MQDQQKIQDALDYIEENIASPITAQELCDRCHYSLYHFYRLFENATGMPVMQYILRRRLLWAAWEIAQGKSVLQAALRYGFDTASGFYKAFRRELGMPPSRFAAVFRLRKPLPIKLAQEAHVMIPVRKLRSILRHWQMDTLPLSPVVFQPSGYISDNAWQVGDDYVLKCSLNPASLQLNARIAKRLQENGFQGALHVETCDHAPYVSDGEMVFALTKRVKGQRRKAQTPQDAFTLGKAIAQLHGILRTEDSVLCREQDVFREAEDTWLAPAAQALKLPEDFVQRYRDAAERLRPLLPVQIIHRDPNPDNMLWQDDEIIGFIDFDLSRKSARLFDVCYAATAILSETIDGPEEALCAWPQLLLAIAKGYDSVSPLSDAEKEALPHMVLTVQFICVGYFATMDKYRELFDKNVRMTRFILDHLHELKLS